MTIFRTLSLFLFMQLSVAFAEGFTLPKGYYQVPFVPNQWNSNHNIRLGSPQRNHQFPFLKTRGGNLSAEVSSSSDSGATEGLIDKSLAAFGNIWGSLGVVYILAKAIKRVLPIALEPLKASSSVSLSPFEWSMYAFTCGLFAYAEGYKGFQLKFSPLVVKRSFALKPGTPQGNNPLNYLLAPLYSMGLINATKKRLIISWCVSTAVALLVALVKRLPPTSRCIMDAGVVVGLTWGGLSILWYYVKALFTGREPFVDACLP